jgi:hypothetical protein
MLLSLDHGPTRALSSLFILKEMMERISLERGLEIMIEPWQVFDLIGGVGTGGVVAIMLGRLRIKLLECIALSRSFRTSTTFDMELLANAIEISPENGGGIMLMGDIQQSCRVYVSSLFIDKTVDAKQLNM